MSITDVRIPSNTLAELRGVLVRALSRENLSVSDKIALRKSHSSSTLRNYNTTTTTYNGGKSMSIIKHKTLALEKRINGISACVWHISVV